MVSKNYRLLVKISVRDIALCFLYTVDKLNSSLCLFQNKPDIRRNSIASYDKLINIPTAEICRIDLDAHVETAPYGSIGID